MQRHPQAPRRAPARVPCVQQRCASGAARRRQRYRPAGASCWHAGRRPQRPIAHPGRRGSVPARSQSLAQRYQRGRCSSAEKRSRARPRAPAEYGSLPRHLARQTGTARRRACCAARAPASTLLRRRCTRRRCAPVQSIECTPRRGAPTPSIVPPHAAGGASGAAADPHSWPVRLSRAPEVLAQLQRLVDGASSSSCAVRSHQRRRRPA